MFLVATVVSSDLYIRGYGELSSAPVVMNLLTVIHFLHHMPHGGDWGWRWGQVTRGTGPIGDDGWSREIRLEIVGSCQGYLSRQDGCTR